MRSAWHDHVIGSVRERSRRLVPRTVAGRLGIVVVSLVLLGIASSIVMIVALGRAATSQEVLTHELVPAQTDANQLSRVYRDLAIGLANGEITAENVALAWQSGREIRNEIRPLLDGGPLGAAFDDVEQAADRWVQIATPSSDRIAVRAALAEYAPLRDSLNEFTDAVDEATTTQHDDARDAARTAQWAAVITGLTLLAAGVAVGVLLRRWVTRPLGRLVGQVGEVASGHLSAPIDATGLDDLSSVAEAVDSMRERLLDEAGQRVDSALIAGHEAERSRIAGDLHDDQVQAMTLASIRLQQLRRRVADDPEATELLAAAQDATNQAISRLRRMIFELHSPVLDTEGLVAAIEVYADETFGDDVAWSIHGEPGELTRATAGLAYRLAREALFNVYKHAAASTVEIVLERTARDLVVSVRDDGRGFDTADGAARPGHLGGEHARQLASAAGGTWTCTSAPGTGTTVRFRLPVASGAVSMTSMRHHESVST